MNLFYEFTQLSRKSPQPYGKAFIDLRDIAESELTAEVGCDTHVSSFQQGEGEERGADRAPDRGQAIKSTDLDYTSVRTRAPGVLSPGA